eukprot:12932931-Prorocentrum_lima.AAC.1
MTLSSRSSQCFALPDVPCDSLKKAKLKVNTSAEHTLLVHMSELPGMAQESFSRSAPERISISRMDCFRRLS